MAERETHDVDLVRLNASAVGRVLGPRRAPDSYVIQRFHSGFSIVESPQKQPVLPTILIELSSLISTVALDFGFVS